MVQPLPFLNNSPLPSLNPAPVPPAPAGTSPVLTPCQPIIWPVEGGDWQVLDEQTDRILAAVTTVVQQLGMEAHVFRNNPFEYPHYVFFEAWLPIEDGPFVTERLRVRIDLASRPRHQFPVEYTVSVFNRGQEKRLGKFGSLTEHDISVLFNCLVRNFTLPQFHYRLREKLSQIPFIAFYQWLTTIKNRPLGLRPPYGKWACTWLFIGGIVFSIGPVFAILGSLDHADEDGSGGLGIAFTVLFFTLLLTGVGAVGGWILKRQTVVVRSTGRPGFQPRSLRLYNSWSAVIAGGGTRRDEFYHQFIEAGRLCQIPGFSMSIERNTRRVLDNLVTVEDLVLCGKRVIVYCHIDQVGNDLFINWESYLNQGRWTEELVYDGIDIHHNRPVKVMGVTIGLQNFAEPDYVEANCLSEWIHRQMVLLAKQLLRDLNIDQEIDFQMVRTNRDQPEPEKKSDGRSGGMWKAGGLFKRKA